jgi:hypothetical protein
MIQYWIIIGDPTFYGNLKIHESCIDAVMTHLKSFKANGYFPSVGGYSTLYNIIWILFRCIYIIIIKFLL